MNIGVCISHVPDTAAKIKIKEDLSQIDYTSVPFIINPYDEFAMEEAIRIKEKSGGTTYAISLGKDGVKESLRKALATGIDEAIHIKTELELDSSAVAKNLCDEIKSLNLELVFMGKQSVDFDSSATGQILSELLGFNCITNCVSFSLDGRNVRAEREIEGGREVLETTLPVIITAQKGLNEPRYASLKGIMAAKKKNIVEKNAAYTECKTKVIGFSLPKGKSAGKVLSADSDGVKELVRLLKEEAKVF
ncbi:MAG: electron transfer flavoprotein subunit beta/FixA family protein [Ignavibacteriaceae bacterium]|nr:electron transfer flavoprotein subunit beta/FixA family protein [Ignavibacteriaceae bacterium]